MKRYRWDAAAMVLLITASCFATICPDVHGHGVYAQSQLSLSGLDGNPLLLPRWRQHVVILNFWSPDCTACIAELPTLQRAYTHYRASGLKVVGVAMPDDDPTLVGAAAAKAHLTYLQGWDSSGRLRQMLGGIAVIPTTVVLAPGGHIVFRHEGPLTDKDIDQLTQSYLTPSNGEKNFHQPLNISANYRD